MLITLKDGTTEQYNDDPFASGAQGTLHLSRDKRWVVKLLLRRGHGTGRRAEQDHWRFQRHPA